MALSTDNILELLRIKQHTSSIPFRPKGGDTICFKGEGAKIQDWRADGHRWVNQGSVGLPRSNPKLKGVLLINK